MADKSQLSLGQTVKVCHLRGISKQDGKIVRIGRELVDIKSETSRSTEAFRIQSQRRNGDDTGTRAYFQTLEQDAAAQRRADAVRVLNKHGVRLDREKSFPVEQLERIAAVLEESG
jgi:hypothetical protein